MLRRLFAVCALVLVAMLAPPAQADTLLTPVYIGNTSRPQVLDNTSPLFYSRAYTLGAPELAQALDSVAAQEAHPQHIVVLIHGWATPAKDALSEFTEVAKNVHADFARRGQTVAVVGIIWPSDIGQIHTWVPQMVAHMALSTVFLGSAIPNPYWGKVWVARYVGRRGARQLLLGLQDRFPHAHLHVWAHSMGAEVTRAALKPQDLDAEDNMPAFEVDKPLHIELITLAGADLDVNAFLESHPNPNLTCRLVWITLPKKLYGQQDEVLGKYRVMVRHTQAIGNSFPLLRPDQFDGACSHGMLVFDNEDVPYDHHYLLYYSAHRTAKLTDAIIQTDDPTQLVSAQLTEIRDVLAADNTISALRPFMDNPHLSTVLYATWRLEHLLEGNCTHLGDGYLEEVVSRMTQEQFDNAQMSGPCKLVRYGLFPPAWVKPFIAKRRDTPLPESLPYTADQMDQWNNRKGSDK